jgi:RNA polymerase sigma-70 factor, ECF subfamily
VERTAQFEELRGSLFSLAYRMLGTRTDAEDVVQNAYLRWLKASDGEIRMPKSYLMTVVSRLSLDALKSAQRKREVYAGPWLPEPLVEPFGVQRLEMAESLSIAFLHVLELLSPAERIAFLLREVFDISYTELAETLENTEENCRQIVARARKHVHAKRPRFMVNHDQHSQVLREFMAACASGNTGKLSDLLRKDAVLYSDGGGKATAALNPISGADRIVRFFAGLAKKGVPAKIRAEFVTVNGQPGALLFEADHLGSVLSVALDESNKVAEIFLILNPDKLPNKPPVSARARMNLDPRTQDQT